MFREPELPSRYGEYNAAGELVKDTQVCAVTGQKIEPGDVTIRVQGSNRFYHIKAAVYRFMTREDHEALYAEIVGSKPFPVGSTFDPLTGVVTIPEKVEAIKPAQAWDFTVDAPVVNPAPTINTSFPTTKTENKGKDIGNG